MVRGRFKAAPNTATGQFLFYWHCSTDSNSSITKKKPSGNRRHLLRNLKNFNFDPIPLKNRNWYKKTIDIKKKSKRNNSTKNNWMRVTRRTVFVSIGRRRSCSVLDGNRTCLRINETIDLINWFVNHERGCFPRAVE